MIEGKIFPNINAANGALNAAQNTWIPPVYSDIGGGQGVQAQSVGAESGIVERPAAKSKRKAV